MLRRGKFNRVEAIILCVFVVVILAAGLVGLFLAVSHSDWRIASWEFGRSRYRRGLPACCKTRQAIVTESGRLVGIAVSPIASRLRLRCNRAYRSMSFEQLSYLSRKSLPRSRSLRR